MKQFIPLTFLTFVSLCCVSVAQAQTLVTSGMVVTDTLSPEGDVDSWSIDVPAGATLRVGVGVETGVDFEPLLRLRSAGQSVLLSNSGAFSTNIVFNATEGGRFAVDLLDASATPNGTGTYIIYFTVTGSPFTVPGNDEGGSLNNGDRVAGTIELGDMDLWSFEASAGEVIRLGAGETNGSGLSPSVLLYGTDGSFIGSNSGSASTDLVATAAVGGTYLAVVQDANNDVVGSGDYELYLTVTGRAFTVPDGDEGGALGSGDRVAGTVELGDMDLWSFEASAGEVIRLGVGEASGSGLSPLVLLYSPDGSFIGSNSGSGSTDLVATASVGGTYLAVVQDGNNDVVGSGSYELYLTVTGRAFTVPPGDEGGTLASGERVSGTVALGDMDLWSFDASAGEVIRLGVGETGGSGLSPLVLLYSPDGSFVGSNSGSASTDLVATASVGGTYLAVVQDGNNDVVGTGDYELYLTVTGRAFTVPSGDEGGALASGDRVAGTVALGDMDLWSFEASAGEVIRLGAGETSGSSFSPLVLLYGPDGDLVGSNSGTSSTDVVAAAGLGGTYLAVVQDGNNDVVGTGSYELYLTVTGRAFAVPESDEGGVLVGGAPVTGTVALGDMDLWEFVASAGDTVVLSASDTAGTALSPGLLVYAPDGRLVIWDSDSSVASVNAEIGLGGRYLVVVQDFTNDVGGSGAYELSFSRTPGGATVPSGSASLIGNGDRVTGSISTVVDRDKWNFSLVEGETTWIQVGETAGSGFDLRLEVFAPNGVLLVSDAGTSSASVSFRVTQSGTYTAVISESGANSTGSYQLFLARSTGGFAVPTGDEGGLVNNGENHNATITLGDVDLWEFEAVAGDPLWLQVGETGGSGFDPFIALYAPDGSLLGRSSGTASGSISVRAPVTGSYRAIVREDGTNATGTYRLHFGVPKAGFAVPAGDEGGLVGNGENHDGSITLGDVDLWEFEAVAGDPLWLQVGETGGSGFDPFIALYAPDGSLLGRSSGTSSGSISVRAPVTGSYRAIVREDGTNATGTYRLHFGVPKAGFTVPSGDEGGLVNNGENHDGSITLGDVDLWEFEAEAGDPLWLQVGETGGSGFDPFIALYAPDGSLLGRASGTASGSISVRAPVTGPYRAIVREGGTNATGTYRLHLARANQPFSVGSQDQGGGIESGMTLNGTLDLGDLDTYGFHAVVGDRVVLNVAELTGSGFDPAVFVYGPDGSLVASASSTSVANLDFVVFATGRYTLVVRESGTNSTGTYALTATGMTAQPVAAALRQPESLAPGRLLLEWPSPSQGWALEESLTLQSGTWSESTVSPADDGFRKSVEIDTTAADRAFFRLAKP